jgi:hypothetical protein
MCVCHARYYRGVGQLTEQFKTAENRHAVKIGAMLARVVIQRSNGLPLVRYKDGSSRAPHGPVRLRRPTAMALASCDVLFDCWAKLRRPLAVTISIARSRRLLRQQAHHRCRRVPDVPLTQGTLQIWPTDLLQMPVYCGGSVVKLAFTTLFATVLFCPANTRRC